MLWFILVICLIVEIVGIIISKLWYITIIASFVSIILIIGDLGNWRIKTFINPFISKLSSKSNLEYVSYSVFAKVLVIVISIMFALYVHLSHRIDEIILTLK